MMPILENFDQFIMDSAKLAIGDFLAKKSPNPYDVLNLLDDASLDWVDSGNSVDFYLGVENFIQPQPLLISNLSTGKGIMEIPFLKTVSEIGHLISRIKSNVHYVLNWNTSVKNSLRGFDMWNKAVYPVLNRLEMEYNVNYINYFSNGYFTSNKMGKDMGCHSIAANGHQLLFAIDHRKLKDELSKVYNVSMFLTIN